MNFVCFLVLPLGSCGHFQPVLNSWRAARLKSKLDVVNGRHMAVAFYEIFPESSLRQIWIMS